ncbi:MAG: DUF386 domain-containing protein [Ruminiclostridium sp.]|nr:DUF386 domain-containing protein [Ruminiclostridium sp.]
MIVDSIENAGQYYCIGTRIEKALRYLKETDFSTMKPGRYEIEGSNIYVLLLEYDTKPVVEGKWEAHRKYIDVQYMEEGAELLGYSLLSNLEVIREYNAEDDYALLKGKGDMITLNSGTFAILYPADAHMPGMELGAPKPVIKVVVKILIA